MVHENLRARARRKAYHALKLGLDVNRRAPTDAETRAFVDAVDQGSVARFGVVKLSKLRLDDPVPTPAWLARARAGGRFVAASRSSSSPRSADATTSSASSCAPARVPSSAATTATTTPSAATAPPTTRIPPTRTISTRTRSRATSARSSPACVRPRQPGSSSSRRRRAAARSSPTPPTTRTHRTTIRRSGMPPPRRLGMPPPRRSCTVAAIASPNVARGGASFADTITRARLVRRAPPSGRARRAAPSRRTSATIPRCPTPIPTSTRTWMRRSFMRTLVNRSFIKPPNASPRSNSPTRPDDDGSRVPSRRRAENKNPRVIGGFRATGPRGCARANLGESRPKRVETLLAAAAEDDARRVFATVRAGVDVDASDEYGMTALATAAWRGNASAAAALLRCGADPRRAARGGEGLDAARAARAAGRTRLAEMLEDEARARDGAEEAGAEAVADADAGSGSGADVGDAGSGSGADVGDAGSGSGADVGDAGSGSGADGNAGSGSGADGAAAPKTSPQSPRVRVLVDPSSNHPGARGSFYVDGAVPESILRRLERVGAAAAKERDADAAAVAVGRLKDLRSDAANRTRADTCADRAHFCDVEGWARRAIVAAARAGGMRANGAHPQMRVLRYDAPGGIMAPHVDLSKLVHPQRRRVDESRGGGEETRRRRRSNACGETRRRRRRRRRRDEDGDGDDAEVLDEDDAEVGSEVGSTHTFILYLVTCASGGDGAPGGRARALGRGGRRRRRGARGRATGSRTTVGLPARLSARGKARRGRAESRRARRTLVKRRRRHPTRRDPRRRDAESRKRAIAATEPRRE